MNFKVGLPPLNLNGIGTLEHLGHLGHLDIGMLDIGTFRHESDRTIDGAWSEIMKEICSSHQTRSAGLRLILPTSGLFYRSLRRINDVIDSATLIAPLGDSLNANVLSDSCVL